MTGPRILTLREWLIEVPAALGESPQALLSEINVEALHAALEAPAAGYRDRLLYPNLPDQAAVLLESALARPPLPRKRRALAFATLLLFLGHNGAELELSDAERSAMLEDARRQPRGRRELAAWIESRLRPTGLGRTPPTGSESSPVPVGCLAMPVCAVRDSQDDLERLHDLAGALYRLVNDFSIEGARVHMKLEIAAIEYADVAGSEVDFVDETDRRLSHLLAPKANDKLRHQILGHLSIASFMIVLGGRVPSFGAGVELGRVGHSTPVLYLNPRGVRRSCWIDDGALFAHLEVAEFADVTEAVDIATAWLVRWCPMIERKWRERQARMLRTAPIAASFLDSWSGISSRESRLEAFTRTGLPANTFFGLFTPDGVAAAPLEDLQAMASALGIAPTGLPSTQTFAHHAEIDISPLTRREYGAFLTAWDTADWDSDRAQRVLVIGRDRARDRVELAKAGVDARQSLSHHTAWLRIEAEP